ncbi:MAG: MASE1 domain-containing protein [Candidatus Rokuibacteriota bacterium]
MADQPRIGWATMVGFALAYVAAAELGQALSVKPGNFATIWPPAGLYLAALLLTPTLSWPRVVASAALANLGSDLLQGQLLWVNLGFCAANALEAIVGAVVLRRVMSVPLTLRGLKNTIAFLGVSGTIAAPCGALAGALTVRIAFGAAFGESWLTWWSADLVGLLVFGPLVLAFRDTTGLREALASRRHLLDAALFVVGTVTATVAVCSLQPPYARAFMLYPLLLWGAMRFGTCGASAGLALVSLIVVAFTVAGRGPFSAPDLPLLGDMRLAQFFLSVAALSSLSLAAVIHERDDAARQLGGLYLELRRDVTERKQTEYLIRQVFERTPDGVAVIGRDYRFRRVNRVYERSWKRPAETIVGRHVADFLGQDLFEERVKGELDRCFAGEHIRYAEWFKTSGGRQFLSVSFSPLRLDSERVEAALTIIRDLTDHMRAVESLQAVQAELAHVTRVMTLGELAASIAHEVNQPLAAVVADATASLNWLASVPPDLDRVRDALDAIVTDAHRAGEVVQRIRQLATKSVPRKDWLDVNSIVRDVEPLLRAELRRHEVALELDLAPGLPPVLGDRVQLQQVLLNLVMNGIEAMAAVTDRSRELLIRSHPHEDAQVRVAVQDTGVGIDPNDLDQLFSAFFTTKPAGMGMGLSICRSIVDAHGGRLWATPNAGHGATFHFALPGIR